MARLRLLPRDERFFELFEQAADFAVAAADSLRLLFTDTANCELYRKQMADIEHAADKLNHEAVDKLNRTFVTPLDPEDIRTIANRLDDIIDFTHAAVERIALYKVTEVNEAAIALSEVLILSTNETKSMVTCLRDMSQRSVLAAHCIEINRLENTGDCIYREALGSLFSAGDLHELFRWKEIIECIERAIDQCEDLANSLELMVTKYS